MKKIDEKLLTAFIDDGRIGNSDQCAINIDLYRGTSLALRFVVDALTQKSNPEVNAMMEAVEIFRQQLRKCEPGKGPLCLACDTRFSTAVAPVDFVTLTPTMMDWTKDDLTIIVTGVCEECSLHDDQHLVGIAKGYAGKLWTNLRAVPEGQA